MNKGKMYYTIAGDFVNKTDKLIEGFFSEEYILKKRNEFVSSIISSPFKNIKFTMNKNEAIIFTKKTYNSNSDSISVLEDLNSSILIEEDSNLKLHVDENYTTMNQTDKYNFLTNLHMQENIKVINPDLITNTAINGFIAIPYNEPISPIENKNECPDNHICIPSNEWESLNLRNVLIDQLPSISYGTTTDETLES